MICKRYAGPGEIRSCQLSWLRGDQPVGCIGYTCCLRDPDSATLLLQYTFNDNANGAESDCTQRIQLRYTQPHYDGKRWPVH